MRKVVSRTDHRKISLVFIFPDHRPDQPTAVMGEGFEVDESRGESVEVLADGSYRLHKVVLQTQLVKNQDGKDVPVLKDTGRRKTITVRPTYLWVEETVEAIPPKA